MPSCLFCVILTIFWMSSVTSLKFQFLNFISNKNRVYRAKKRSDTDIARELLVPSNITKQSLKP